MKKIYTTNHKTPVGELILGQIGDSLCLCDWSYRKMRGSIDKRIKTHFAADFISSQTDFLQNCKAQIDEYFAKERETFDINLKVAGTNFQESVWNMLCNINYGNTVSYIELSKIIGDEKAIRAVASANGANAISIIIPCHRVIGSNGQLTGYAGGLKAKEYLLNLEGSLDKTQLKLF